MTARNKRMEDMDYDDKTLSGLLLISHPSLMDENFKHSIVLISAHSKETGALGVVLNRPLDQTLADIKDEYMDHPLGKVPLYFGGPVSPGEMVLTAWQGTAEPGVYKLYFGLSEEKARELIEEDPDIDIRGFIGYSGWSSGQLEGELKDNAWAVSPMDGKVLMPAAMGNLWRSLLKRVRPEWSFLVDAPEDPSLN